MNTPGRRGYTETERREAVFEKIQKADNGCWVWMGSFDTHPQMTIRGRAMSVRKYLYRMRYPNKELPRRFKVKCGLKYCVNPKCMEARA